MTALEDRLRATLTAEADRHPVRPDLEAVRHAPAGAPVVIDLHAAPRRNRARVVAAAAVLLLVAAGVIAAVANRDDGRQPVIADTPRGATTGFYLPGEDWEILAVDAMPGATVTAGLAREALFTTRVDGLPVEVDARVVLSTDAAAATEEWAGPGGFTEVPPSDGAPRPMIWVDEESGSVVASTGDLLLYVMTSPEMVSEAIGLAHGWWASEGAVLATPPGLERAWDVSHLDPTPAAPGRELNVSDPGPAVQVSVRSPSGVVAPYVLGGLPADLRPTGWEGADAAEAAGLSPEEAPSPVDEATGDHLGLLGGGGAIAFFPDVVATAEDRPELDALRPVTAAEWADRLRSSGAGVDPDVLVDRLADVVPRRQGTTGGTTMPGGASDTTVPTSDTTEAVDDGPSSPSGPSGTTEPIDGPGAPIAPDGASLTLDGQVDAQTASALLSGEDVLGCEPPPVGAVIEWPDPLGPFPGIEEAVRAAYDRTLAEGPEASVVSFTYGVSDLEAIGVLMTAAGRASTYVSLALAADGTVTATGVRTCGG